MKKRKTASPNRIVLPKPVSFTNECRHALAEVLENTTLSFKEVHVANGGVVFALTGYGSVGVGEEFVLPIRGISSGEYWLGTALAFEPHLGEYALKGISVKLFRGFRASEKMPVLRAEWDNPNSAAKADHAQPHWHAYPAVASVSMGETRPLVGEMVEFGDPQQSSLDPVQPHRAEPLVKMHLAMSSTWHLAGGTHQLRLDNRNYVLAWLTSCVTYIIRQLKYASH